MYYDQSFSECTRSANLHWTVMCCQTEYNYSFVLIWELLRRKKRAAWVACPAAIDMGRAGARPETPAKVVASAPTLADICAGPPGPAIDVV